MSEPLPSALIDNVVLLPALTPAQEVYFVELIKKLERQEFL
jgi:hypothetical protein